MRSAWPVMILVVGLALRSAPGATLGVVDTSFRPRLNARPDMILPADDGRIYVTGNDLSFMVAGRTQPYIARLNADGSVDPSFVIRDGLGAPTLPGGGSEAVVRSVAVNAVVQPDSRVVIFQQFSIQGRGVRSRTTFTALGRLNRDGSRDPSFQPAGRLAISTALPILLRDGRWLVAESSRDAEGNATLALDRFLPDGAVDPAFPALALRPSRPARAVSLPDQTTPDPLAAPVSAVDAAGRVYVVIHHDYAVDLQALLWINPENPKATLFRLNPDGTPDPGFPDQLVDQTAANFATTQGIVVEEAKWHRVPQPDAGFSAPVGIVTISRRTSDGANDPAFAPIVTQFKVPPLLRSIIAANDGGLFAVAQDQRAHRGVLHYLSNGGYDADFALELGDAAALVGGIASTPGGALYAWGSFQSIGDTGQPYLARLTPNTHALATRLSNVAARAQVETRTRPLIAGFIVQAGAASVLVRATGPSLAAFGVDTPLSDLQLALYFGARLVASNDRWDSNPAGPVALAAKSVDAFPWAAGSRDAALISVATPGAWTAQVTATGATAGDGLIEVFQLPPAPADGESGRLANISVRATLTGNSGPVIVGFSISGDTTRTVLLRAVGPSLAGFGVADAVANPVLKVYQGNTVLAENDDWGAVSPDETTRRSEAMNAAGAFPLDSGSRDAAIVLTLPPGMYTAHTTAAPGSGGTVLVEVYEIP